MTSKEFGMVVRHAADKKGVKYSHIADKLGLSRQVFYSRLEDGHWKLDEALKVMKMLGISPDVFL